MTVVGMFSLQGSHMLTRVCKLLEIVHGILPCWEGHPAVLGHLQHVLHSKCLIICEAQQAVISTSSTLILSPQADLSTSCLVPWQLLMWYRFSISGGTADLEMLWPSMQTLRVMPQMVPTLLLMPKDCALLPRHVLLLLLELPLTAGLQST